MQRQINANKIAAVQALRNLDLLTYIILLEIYNLHLCANIIADAAADLNFHPDAVTPAAGQFKLAHARKQRSQAADDRQSSIGIEQSPVTICQSSLV